MRVLLLAQFYPPDIGGEERHVANLARGLLERGHEVEVITTLLPHTPRGLRIEEGVPVRRVESSAQRLGVVHSSALRPHAMPLPDRAMRETIAERLRYGHFDVVHAHNWIVNSALGPASQTGTPLVLTLHDYSHLCATKRLMRLGAVCSGPGPLRCTACAARHYGKLMGPAVAAANAVARGLRERGVSRFVAVSHSVADRSGLRAAGLSYEVIPNFIPDELVAPAPPAPSGPILFVGDLVADKGIEVLLEAYARLEHPVPLRLLGRPSLELHLPKGAELLPPRAHDAVMELIRASQIVVVPSIVADACPTVVLEAMACGRPIVAAASGGIVDLLEDDKSALLVPPGDPKALAEAIEMLLADPTRAAAIGQIAASEVLAFTASRVLDRLEALYEEVIDDARITELRL